MTQVDSPPRTTEVRAAAPLVETGDDPSPLARLVARRLERHLVEGSAATLPDSPERGSVVVRSHDTPQVVAVLLGREAVAVVDTVPGEPDADLTVDIGARFSLVGEPRGEQWLTSLVLDALHAPPPAWREEAQRFWDATRDIAGIPDVLVLQAHGAEGFEELRVGSGNSQYVVAGTEDQLAGVLSGVDDLLAALETGVTVQGTLADLSVMTAASWRVRYGF